MTEIVPTSAFRKAFKRKVRGNKILEARFRDRVAVFQENPFDPRLRTHKIHRLSAIFGKTIYAVEVGADLRSIFYIEADTVWSIRIGTHDLYEA